MATITARVSKSGIKTFKARVRLKGYSTETASFERLTDAKRWAQSVEVAMKEGRHFKTAEAKRHTLSDAIARYEADVLVEAPKNAPNTRRHLAWWKSMLGTRLLADITPALIAEKRQILLRGITRRGRPRTPATVQRYLAALSHLFTMAVKDWHWAEDNPVLKISRLRQARGRERYLSDAERHAILDVCRQSSSQYLYPVVVLAISTGMRRGEIMGLRWPQIDLTRCRIILSETKNNTSRAVPLHGHALTEITRLSKVRRLDTDLVFPGRDPHKPVDIKKPWDTAVRKAALKDFRFHDLRHTAASYMAMNGATTLDIAAVLGHKTLAMVKRYSHLSNNHTSSVVQAMNEKIFGTTGS